MNTRDNKRSIIVGLFVFIGLVILVVGILVLGNQQSKFGKNLVVTTYFSDVKGLKIGNNVWFSGVKVGIIKDIKFEGIQNVKVVMHIEEKSSNFIRKDVHARLGSDGLIGNSIITLMGGSNEVPAIADGDVILSEAGTDVEAMMQTLQTNNKNLVEITENFVSISKDLAAGRGLVGAMLTDTSLVIGLKNAVSSLNSTMNSANRAVDNLGVLTAKLINEEGLIHDLTTDTAVFASLRESAVQLQGVTQTATALMSNLNEVTERLNDKNNAIGVLTNDPEAAEEIKSILHNLNLSTEKLDENMEALQHNFLLRRYFKKKQKEDK